MAAHRILHVLGQLGNGGAESMIMNIYREINLEKIQFDFLTRGKNNESLLKEVNRMGGRVFNSPTFPKDIIANCRYVKNFFREIHRYSIVHVHANALIYIVPLIIAKKYKAKTLILHSHSTKAEKRIFVPFHFFNRFIFLDNFVTDRFSCSDIAGKWMFGSRDYIKINNAINLEKFTYNKEKSMCMRNLLNLRGKMIIGHVGKFTTPKNHDFIIDIFKEVNRKYPNSVLLLIGDGKLKNKIHKKILNLDLEGNVIFTGNILNVNDYMNIMDVFLFPSLYEGLPVAVVEAQAIGLPCIISDVITDQVCVTENVTKISLNQTAETWANKVIKCFNYSRKDMKDKMIQAGFDIKTQVRKLENFYLAKLKNDGENML